MPRKALQVQVELDLQAVTCPGVWLCPNGKISLHIYMLDSCIQTDRLQPLFPLLYHEKFIFYKTFYTAHSLSDLQRLLNKEYLYAELVQWQNCDLGNALATFQTPLTDVLYPTSYESAIAGVDVDLLMEPSKNFPGIIAPKIEISTRTTVKEVVCSSDSTKNSFVVNPKTIPSDEPVCHHKRSQLRQQKVCHSIGYHKSRRCTKLKMSNKPPFVFRKAEEELLARKPQGLGNGCTRKSRCGCRSQSTNTLTDSKKAGFSGRSPSEKTYSKLTEEFLKQYPKPAKAKLKYVQRGRCPRRTEGCTCGHKHSQENCPLCSKYHCYFNEGLGVYTTSRGTMGYKHSPVKDSYVHKVTTDSPAREYQQSVRSPVRTLGRQYHRPSSFSKTRPRAGSPQRPEPRICDCSPSSSESRSGRRSCLCPPLKKLSLAEQIHSRLKQTLDCRPVYPFVDLHQGQSSDADSSAACSGLKLRDCKEGVCRSLGKFYRNLQRC